MRLFTLLAWLLLLPGITLAGDAASTVIDWTPLLNQYVLPFVFSLLGLLGMWALALLRKRLGLANDAQLSQTLEQAMTNGLAFAQSQLAMKIAAGPVATDVKSEAVAIAARYAAEHVPAAMTALGVTPELLAQKIEARLTLNTTPPEQSLAVPTPPAATKV